MVQPKIKVSELYQVGIVVRDIEISMRDYESILGISTWQVFDADPSVVSDVIYHGRPVQHRFRVALAMVGTMQLELIQPVEGDSTFGDFLNAHGDGIHHLGHVRVDNLDEAVQSLEKDGFPCLQRGSFPGIDYAYMDLTSHLGYIIELTSGMDPRSLF